MEIDLKKIKELMLAMGRHGISLLKIRKGDEEIKLEQGGRMVAPPPPPPAAEAAVVEEREPPKSGSRVTSPMVGTFYKSPSPEAEPFVKVGDRVDEETIVCIVEAMKVMNEVKAGVKGVVREVLVSNGDPVEFGSELFLIE